MSGIPYNIGKRISDQLGWPNKIYWTIFEVLINANGLGILSGQKEGWWSFKPETIETVLRHIVYRTIQFDKMFEFVRRKDVIKGMPCIAIAGCGLSETMIKNILGQLWRDKILIKLRFVRDGKRIITPLYGLNMPLLFVAIEALWRKQIKAKNDSNKEYGLHPAKKPSNLMLRSRCQLRCCLEFLLEWKSAFDFLTNYSEPITNIDDFISEWSESFIDSENRKIRRGELIQQFESLVAECKKVRQLHKEYLKEMADNKLVL